MAQGDIAIFQDTTGGQNLNSTSFTDIPLNNTVVAEGLFADVDGTEKDLPENTRVLVLYNLHTTSTGSNRSITEIAINFNGSEITTGRSSGYLRRSAHSDTVQTGAAVLPTTTGDVVKLTGRREDSNTGAPATLVANESAIQMIEIPTSFSYYNAIANVAKNAAGVVTGAPATWANIEAGTWADVDWDVVAEEGTSYSTLGGAGTEEIQVPNSHLFLTYGVDGHTTSTSARTNLVARVMIREGTGSWNPIDYTYCTGYLRGSNNCQDSWANWFGILDLTGYTDPRIKIQFIEENENGSTNGSYETAYIQMFDIPDTADFVRLDELSADETSIITTAAPLDWEATASELDTGSFGHPTNTEIRMTQTGKYLFFASQCANRSGTDSTRKEPQLSFAVEATEIPYSKGSNFSRGDQSTTSTWYAGRATGLIYDNDSANDDLTVLVYDHANGTDRDLVIEQERAAVQGVNITTMLTPPNPLLEDIKYTFNDDSFGDWETYLNSGAGSVTATNGRVEIVSPTTTSQATGMWNGDARRFHDTSIHIEVSRFDIVANQEFWFGIYTGGDYMAMGIQPNGDLIGILNEGGLTQPLTTTYDSEDHRWLRMRETSGTIYWETSADGESWTVEHSQSHSIDFSTCWTETYIYGSAPAATSTAYIDYINTNKRSETRSLQYVADPTQNVTKSLSYNVMIPDSATKSLQYVIADKFYTKSNEASLPTDATDLSTAYTSGEYDDVDDNDDVFVSQTGEDNVIHQFRQHNTSNTDNINVTARVKSDLAPSASTVYLQAYENGGVDTYYFDASVAGPTDPNSAWTNDANAFDGNTGTYAQNSATGSTSSQYLEGGGTTAPASGSTIQQVRLRVHGQSTNAPSMHASVATDNTHSEILGDAFVISASETWGDWVVLSEPAGGWDWDTLQNLYVRLYESSGMFTFSAARRVEIEVTSGGWVTIDSDSSTAADTEFALTGTINTNVENYYDDSNFVAFRVYQVKT